MKVLPECLSLRQFFMATGKLLQIAVREYGIAEKQNQAANKDYYVGSGRDQTLYSIARNHGVTVDDLKRWNGLTGDTIYVGQALHVSPPTGIAVTDSRILQYAKECGFDGITSEKDAWCSVGLNWVCMKAELPRSYSAAARSWLTVGQPVDDLYDADIAVFWRDNKDSIYGHVGIPLNYTDDKKSIWVYGANQSNMWCVKPYPVERLLGFRKLI